MTTNPRIIHECEIHGLPYRLIITLNGDALWQYQSTHGNPGTTQWVTCGAGARTIHYSNALASEILALRAEVERLKGQPTP